jgi:micrococcal nuclease
MYEYKLKEVKSIYDGDTITVYIDLGFGVTKLEKFRLAYINAPELRGPEREEGLISRNWLRERIETAMINNQTIIIKTKKDAKGKYGRYIADIIINGTSINLEAIELGYAKAY